MPDKQGKILLNLQTKTPSFDVIREHLTEQDQVMGYSFVQA
jgi:hypothetical protein